MIQGRYLVVHLIGKGGMGEVYLAVDQRLGSAVAVKRTSFAEDALLAAAFEREAKILARLRHPVLPKVSDHFVDNGEQYLVMEHISGDDLSKRLENAGKPFPVSWVMFWADQLLDALSYLHSHEPPIIHRDIKPQNLKLTDENHIVLLDFGLSKDTANRSVVSQPGTSGSVVGYTPHFAPMEQIRGTGTNPRSDIYALSATLYQLMTETVPADALTRADAMLSGQPDPIRPLSEITPEISPAVSNVILKGLEVTQEKRFPTASEMQRALRSAYAQMQGQMSADTVAFNVADHAGADIHTTSPPIDHGRSVAPSEMATRTPSIPRVSTPVQPTVTSPPDFDATLRMDDPQLKQALRRDEDRTEVLLGSDISDDARPETAAAETEVLPRNVGIVNETPASPYATEIPAPPPPDVSATAHEIDVQQAPSPAYAAPATVAAINTPPEPMAQSTELRAAAVAPTPKSKSKAGLILAGLAALFILAGVAAAGGWFYYSRYMTGASVKASPSPTAAVTPSPSPSATPEPTQSPDVVIPTPGTPTPAVSPTPTAADTITTKPTPQTGPKNTPTSIKPPTTPKATPKPKAGNDRTVILQ